MWVDNSGLGEQSAGFGGKVIAYHSHDANTMKTLQVEYCLRQLIAFLFCITCSNLINQLAGHVDLMCWIGFKWPCIQKLYIYTHIFKPALLALIWFAMFNLTTQVFYMQKVYLHTSKIFFWYLEHILCAYQIIFHILSRPHIQLIQHL